MYKDGSLEITQVIEQDTGVYKCIAKFRSLIYESREALVQINPLTIEPTTPNETVFKLTKSTPKFYLWPEDRNLQEDEEVIFECLAQNDAAIFSDFSETNSFKYTWLKDGVALDLKPSITKANKRMQLVQGTSLRIEKVQETDVGTYTCRICNSDQESFKNNPENKNFDYLESNTDREECDERSGALKVLVAPRFIKRPSNLNITLKSDAELECTAYGVPTPVIQWFKNGEPIYPSEYFQFNSNQGNLKILGIIAQDEGYYQCLASNELNTIQSVAQLTVLSDDYSNDNPQLNEDYEESEYALNKMGSKSKKATISPSSHVKQKASNLFSFASTIAPTSSVVHLSAPVNLRIIRSKPRALQLEWHAPSIVRNEDKLNLNKDSLIYSVNWKAKNTDRQRELNTTNASILIDELTPDTVYIIYVSAMMSGTKGPYSFVEAKTDPEALLPGPPVDFKAEFIDFNLPSESFTSLTPTLKFKWKKPIINSENILKYRLFYQHVHYGPISQGDLQSLSNRKNANQSNSNEFQPSDVDSVNEDTDDDDLASNEEFEFDVFEKKKVEKINEKFIDIDIPSELGDSDHYYEFLLEDLLKYSTYKFRLIAIDKIQSVNKENKTSADNEIDNNYGEDSLKDDSSNLSFNGADIIVETPSDVPDGPPENLQVETLNTTSVIVQWNLPATEKRNGLIIGYKIAVKENDKQVWHSNVDSEPRRKIISGLLPGHKYSFRVTAKTVNGSGPASEWIIAETFSHEMDESKVPGQPVEINTEPTDKNIVIQWLPPVDSNRTLVRKYLLKYGIGYPDTEVEIPGNRNSYIINNLSENYFKRIIYKIQINLN